MNQRENDGCMLTDEKPYHYHLKSFSFIFLCNFPHKGDDIDYSAMYGNSKVFSVDTLPCLKMDEEDSGYVDDAFINETLAKFVNCVNYLNNKQ